MANRMPSAAPAMPFRLHFVQGEAFGNWLQQLWRFELLVRSLEIQSCVQQHKGFGRFLEYGEVSCGQQDGTLPYSRVQPCAELCRKAGGAGANREARGGAKAGETSEAHSAWSSCLCGRQIRVTGTPRLGSSHMPPMDFARRVLRPTSQVTDAVHAIIGRGRVRRTEHGQVALVDGHAGRPSHEKPANKREREGETNERSAWSEALPSVGIQMRTNDAKMRESTAQEAAHGSREAAAVNLSDWDPYTVCTWSERHAIEMAAQAVQSSSPAVYWVASDSVVARKQVESALRSHPKFNSSGGRVLAQEAVPVHSDTSKGATANESQLSTLVDFFGVAQSTHAIANCWLSTFAHAIDVYRRAHAKPRVKFVHRHRR